jgi:hypothetical protein
MMAIPALDRIKACPLTLNKLLSFDLLSKRLICRILLAGTRCFGTIHSWPTRLNDSGEKHEERNYQAKIFFQKSMGCNIAQFGFNFSFIFSVMRLGFNLETLSLLIALIGFCFWWTRYLIRHFIFTPSSFTLVRYIMPPKTINYAEITDIGNTKIKTKIGNINLTGITNVGEIIDDFNDLINQGKINRNQLEKKVRIEEITWHKSILPALIISLPFWGMLFYFWPFHKMWFSPLGLGLACGLILFFFGSIVQWIVKKKLINGQVS